MLKKIVTIRITEAVIEKAEELQEKFPDCYKNFSEVARAGVIVLHKKKMRGL